MARRVGFGNRDSGRSAPPPVRDREQPPAERPEPTYEERLARGNKMLFSIRLFSLAFLSIWLLGWSAGIIFAVMSILNSDHPFTEFFLIIWALGASLGWVVAARAWWFALRGK